MALSEQKGQKSFGLHDSRDMLEKLRWELSNLFCRQRYNIAVCQYHAFNCAVTAWHVTDWLWQDISSSPELKIKLQEIIHKPLNTLEPFKLEHFQNYVRVDCGALRLCYQIATGSKHCLFERKAADSTISAIISDGEGYDYGNPIIVEGDTHHMADKVFYEAQFWFEAFLRDWNIFPEEPFVPMGDR
ncbi:MAG: hypothetical protein WA635_07595 [Gallionella sp.]